MSNSNRRGVNRTIWQDDEFVYVPEELFDLLPAEYRAAADAIRERGEKTLRIVDEDLQRFANAGSSFQTVASLRYNFHRLRALEFDGTMDCILEHELRTTAFAVTYGRLFVDRASGRGVSRRDLPEHLRAVHDDLMELRHKRYAHDGGHDSLQTDIQIEFDEDECRLSLHLELEFHWGGRNEWEELVTFLDAHMHERLQKTLLRLKKRTGREWKFPDGPPPTWISK